MATEAVLRRIFLALICALLASCAATISDMKKPNESRYFVLDKDHVRSRLFGLRKLPLAEGLRAGTYKLIAESDDGQYFMGPYDCVFMLGGSEIEKYQQTGAIPPIEDRTKGLGFTYTGTAGVWLPKPGAKKPLRLFYELHNKTRGDAAGLVGTTIVSLTEGDLLYIDYATEAEFFASQSIKTGEPPSN